MFDASRALLVAFLAAGVCAAAGLMTAAALTRWVWDRLRTGPMPIGQDAVPVISKRRSGRPARAARTLILVLAVLGIAGALYARLVEPFWPAVEHVQVRTPKLPAGAGPVRLVLIADTHCDPEARAEPRVPEIVSELHPDLIVFAGDSLNSTAGLAHFRKLMAGLAAIAPTYAVRGNWDVWYFSRERLFDGTGVEVLDGRGVPVRTGGSEIWLAGAAVQPGMEHDREAARDVVRRALANMPGDRPAVFVHHYPEVAALGVESGADLCLAGDTHGGQVRLPGLGALLRLSRLGGYYDTGLHDLGGGKLYVNRGLGMEGGRAPRVRFLCRPEITLLEILPAPGAAARP